MLNNVLDVVAARGGAAFPGVRSPWTSLSAVGTDRLLAQTHVLVAGTPDARHTAFRPTPAMTMRVAAMAAALPATTDIRKQYAHKTRNGAGGDGAMGPHPEREPA